MRRKGRHQLRAQRGARRYLWKPYRSQILGSKGTGTGILLTYNAQRRHELVKKCKMCQDHAQIFHLPSEPLTSITSPWPFQQWGLDILGPLPIGKSQCKFIVIGVDYFTKWAKAEPLATITEQKVCNFVWCSIICRFGIPRAMVSDNGKQFDNPKFREFCAELGIKNYYSSPAYP